MKSLNLFLLFLITTYANNLFAGVITLPFEDVDFKFAPADDLTYQNKKINTVKAIELSRSGIDLSTLDPENSSLYSSNGISTDEIEIDINLKSIEYHSPLSAPTEFFRASVNIENENYTISASLYNHQTLLRAALLNSIGYNVQIPIYLNKFKLNFNSLLEKETFLESLGQATLLSVKRWAPDIESEKQSLSLTLRGFILEPADIKTVPVYWPIMENSRQKNRRVFRSLLYIYGLTDFSGQINNIPWSYGKVFNNELNIAHSYSSAFSNVTIDDFKWMHRKIANLSEADLEKCIRNANYPIEIEKLLFEKLKSRINSIGNLIQLPTNFSVNNRLNILGVVNGKLMSNKFPNHVPTFWEEDPKSPFRFSEIFKLLRSQIVYDSISGLLDSAVEKFVPNITISEAAKEIQTKIRNFRQDSGTVPLQFWSYPIAEGSVIGNRSIVFGQYQGSTAPIQLVDQIGFKLSAGLLNILSLNSTSITPSILLNASIQRSWTHVRSMPDLSTATGQKATKILVPLLMKKLGKVISADTSCSLTKHAWVTEEIITTFRTWVIYFDKDHANGRVHALKLREDLITEGTDPDKIIFSPVSKTLLCEKEINEKTNKNVEDFLKEFALDETITISDSIVFNAQASLKYDVSYIDKLKAELAYKRSKLTLRSYSIRKTSLGLEITIQNQHNKSHEFRQELKFLIEFLSNSNKWLTGDMENQVYKIKLVEITKEEQIAAINTLREIFIRNSFSQLQENYNPISLDHQARVYQRTTRFLWKKWEKLTMAHEVEIIVPNLPHNIAYEEVEEESNVWTAPAPVRVDLDEKDRKRIFYSTLDIKRKGNNYHHTLDQLVNELTFSWMSLGSNDQDPGRSFYGNSSQESFITESEITEGQDLKPTTKVEYNLVGWRVNMSQLNKYLDKYEYYYNFPGNEFKIDRSIFNQTSYLNSYDIRSTIVFYPAAMEKFNQSIIKEKNTDTVLQHLKSMYGEERWMQDCSNRRIRNYTFENITIEKIKFIRRCIPKTVHYILRIRGNGFSSEKKRKTLQINELYKNLFYFYKTPNILAWFGKENFFSITYLSGFRKNDSEGHLQYTTDSVGTYQEEYAAGLLNHIASVLGVTAYTVKAMNYTPGMGI